MLYPALAPAFPAVPCKQDLVGQALFSESEQNYLFVHVTLKRRCRMTEASYT